MPWNLSRFVCFTAKYVPITFYDGKLVFDEFAKICLVYVLSCA